MGIKIRIMILIGFVVVACGSLKIVDSDSMKEQQSEQEKEFLQHKRMVYDCFKRYMDYSNFLDTSSFVTATSVEKFKELFADNAKVWNDYLWEPQSEYADVYADQVYYYHRIRGLKVEYEDDVLDRLYGLNRNQLLKNKDSSDPDNAVFKYAFKARKGIYYILNKEKKVIYYNEPIEFELDFIFHVSSDEAEAKIIDILPVNSKD